MRAALASATIGLIAIGSAFALRSAPSSPTALALVPPPQRSLDVPPIIDPTKTAILSGLVPLKATPESVVPDGLRSVVWVAKPASMKTPALSTQVMVLGAWGFRPATVAATPRTPIELRGAEQGIRQVRGRGLVNFERRLNRAVQTTPVVPERAGTIELEAEASDDAPSAKGAIVVVDTPYLAVSGPNGEFQIVGLPPGRRQVFVRMPDGKQYERTVDLRAGGELVVDWRDMAEPKSAPPRPPPSTPGASAPPAAPPASPPAAPPSAAPGG